jgi:hypothetical protein
VEDSLASRVWSYRDSAIVHLVVGGLVVFFVLSPAIFTPWGFGPDYTNHLWLVWQQAHAIHNVDHPTLYLQTPGGIFEPFYAFYGGTLYGAVGTVTSIVGLNHAFAVYTASIGAAIAIAYGGMWWLGRQIGLARWVAHLPAFVVVTGGYYLTDAYARGAWPELVALSALPLFIAGDVRLLTGPWRPWPVALFALGTIVLTGSHNLTLFWSVTILAPLGVVALFLLGRDRPRWRRVWATLGLAVLATGVNAWFLLLDLVHSSDVQAWAQGKSFLSAGGFESFFYFDNLGNVLDPLRVTPAQSTTAGLTIAPPIIAFLLSVAMVALAWPTLGKVGRWAKVLWLLLLAAMAVLVLLLVMPVSWWMVLGQPFTDIQFPYRLAGYLLIALAVQLALSLYLARGMSRVRKQVAVILGLAVVAMTVAQATAQMYSSARVDKTLYGGQKVKEWAFANGPLVPPATWYDPYSYADASLPVVPVSDPNRTYALPEPEPGQKQVATEVPLPPGSEPIETNIGGGPYAVKVGGDFKVVGRTEGGGLVVNRPAGKGNKVLTVAADAGAVETVGVILSVLCGLGVFGLLLFLMIRLRRERNSRDPGRSPPLAVLMERLPDRVPVHLAVGALVCFFVLSPIIFTPTGFGYDYSNHLWLLWQQGLAISHNGHPTLYLQTWPKAIFEPFYGFYGGTLYAIFGTASAILGNHAYPVYVASFGLAAALAYSGMWWLGRQLGLSRWASHLPAFVMVTAAYYLTDAYARGAWPELVALSAVPMFVAGGARLITGPWRAGPVALFAIGTVVMTGSHNITLLFSAVVIGPIAVLAWLVAGASRPSLRSVGSTVLLAAVAVGVNGWFLLLDLLHSGDTLVGANPGFAWGFTSYFDKLGVILNPIRDAPVQSSTYNLTIAAPVAALALSVVVTALAWPQVKRMGRWWMSTWLILLAAMFALVGMMIMPGSWWEALGTPFTLIQFPYRLSGWLLVLIAVQLAVSLRFARGLRGDRREVVIVLSLLLVVLTTAQASAEMFTGLRVEKKVLEGFVPRRDAFVNGPTHPPETYYDPNSYGDGSLPLVTTERGRVVYLPSPEPGQTHFSALVHFPPGSAPVESNIAAGPYVARVEGVSVLGRSAKGRLVLKPPAGGRRTATVTLTADAGGLETFGSILSIVCIIVLLVLIAILAAGRPARLSRALRGLGGPRDETTPQSTA